MIYYVGIKPDNDLFGGRYMKHVKTLNTRNLKESMKKGGCGEC